MISDDMFIILANEAAHQRGNALMYRGGVASWATWEGPVEVARAIELAERLAVEYDQIAKVGRLYNTDPHLRDAVADAQARQSAPKRVAESVAYWDRVAAKFRERTGGGSAAGLTPEHLDLLVEIANEMRGEGEPPAAIGDPCHECGEPSVVLCRPLCEPCFDVENAVNLVPIDPQEQADAMADHEDEFPDDGQPGTCAPCGQSIRYVDCPTGGWWAHEVHPADGHDATPFTQTAAEEATTDER